MFGLDVLYGNKFINPTARSSPKCLVNTNYNQDHSYLRMYIVIALLPLDIYIYMCAAQGGMPNPLTHT